MSDKVRVPRVLRTEVSSFEKEAESPPPEGKREDRESIYGTQGTQSLGRRRYTKVVSMSRV